MEEELEANARASILLHELKQVVATEKNEVHNASNFKAMARTLLAVIQAQMYVDSIPSEQVPFGLTSEIINETWGLDDGEKLSMMKEAMRVLLPPEIEQRLEAKCRLLCDLFYPLASDSSLPFSQVHCLPSEIAKVKLDLETKMQEKNALEEACEQGYMDHIQLMIETIQHLVVVIKCYKLDLYDRYSTVKLDFLQACISAIQRKIELTTKQLQAQIYSKDNLIRLQAFRQRLEMRRQNALDKKIELQTQLNNLGTTGEFDTLCYVIAQEKIKTGTSMSH